MFFLFLHERIYSHFGPFTISSSYPACLSIMVIKVIRRAAVIPSFCLTYDLPLSLHCASHQVSLSLSLSFLHANHTLALTLFHHVWSCRRSSPSAFTAKFNGPVFSPSFSSPYFEYRPLIFFPSSLPILTSSAPFNLFLHLHKGFN